MRRAMRALCILITAAAAGPLSPAGRASAVETATLTPVKDNTLYQTTDGSLSNGRGSHIFTGNVGIFGGGRSRRAVLAFAVADSIPAGAMITAVRLTLNMSRAPNTIVRETRLHRLLADWGEGASDAIGNEGAGAPSQPGDATWKHTFFNTAFWSADGGDFDATASASQFVSVVGPYTWSSPQMVADVQMWLDTPAANFGWIVIGVESVISTAKRFDSKEHFNPAVRPKLVIEYEPDVPVEPSTWGRLKALYKSD